MPILGIIDSAKTGNLVTNSYEAIASATPTGTVVTFSSIPSTYVALQIRANVQTNRAATFQSQLAITFNNDTSANYGFQSLYTAGFSTMSSNSAATGNTSTGNNYMYAGLTQHWNSGSYNNSAWNIIDIAEYANTSKYKTLYSLAGTVGPNAVQASTWFDQSYWLSTSAINRIDITSAYSYNSGTTFALYGIKGS
jgi:hypothetical protein